MEFNTLEAFVQPILDKGMDGVGESATVRNYPFVVSFNEKS